MHLCFSWLGLMTMKPPDYYELCRIHECAIVQKENPRFFEISEEFEEVPVQSRGVGILDVGYRSKEEAWAAGGSGILLRTRNVGKSWNRDKAADNITANLYAVKFVDEKKGFVLGNDGVLLRYVG